MSVGAVIRTAAVIGMAVLLAAAAPMASSAAEPTPGSSGTDTSLPATDSAATLSGRGRFSHLKVSVNQTKNLVDQAVSVTWTGAKPTGVTDSKVFGHDFLQMFQCWGDPTDEIPSNPGPPREQCEQGATNGVFGGRLLAQFEFFAPERFVSRRGFPNFDAGKGAVDPKTGNVAVPFKAVDGTVVPLPVDSSFNANVVGGQYWLNPYFNVITTNEIAGARTQADGSGSELFETVTGQESTGLGCGQKVQKLADGSTKVPECWLVVVPRGSPADENAGLGLPDNDAVASSPLSDTAWKNRIAFPLSFNPVDSPCDLSAQQRTIAGSELLAAAVSSWQPKLCATPGLSPFAYGLISDSRARDQITSGVPGGAGMAVVSRPVDPSTVTADNPIVYAPLSVSGTVIGFNIQRVPGPGQETTPEGALGGVRVEHLDLTPRLVAKLLTASYREQIEINSIPQDGAHKWAAHNPTDLFTDPDFLQFNPEFRLLTTGNVKDTSGLVVEGPNADAAQQVWLWIFSDPEAKAWLAGTADPFGMKVNPSYAADPALNPGHASFGDPLPDTYPKNEQYCFQGPALNRVVPPPLCSLDWMPYAQSMRDAAHAVRTARDGARTTVNADAASTADVYKADPPQTLGKNSILAVTDSASASQYGLQTASLSRAGDDGAGRGFVAPDAAGLKAGLAAEAPGAVPDVLEPDPTKVAPGAYPLTALTYAAVAPASLDAKARAEYAAFISYGAGPGQVPGVEFGDLPPGYQPLPDALKAQSAAAAARIKDFTPPVDAPPDSTPAGGSGAARSSGNGVSSGGGTVTSLTPGPALSITNTTDQGGKSPLDTIADTIKTPIYHVAATRFALPFLVVLATLAALGSLEITKRPDGAGAGGWGHWAGSGGDAGPPLEVVDPADDVADDASP